MIKYVEPNIILTWNLTETSIVENCQKLNNNVKIKGNRLNTVIRTTGYN